jgi:hypothetical protein
MHSLKKIIFLLLFVISFSCKTRLEKQGWQRTAIVSRLDTSTTNKKDKELFVIKIQGFPSRDSVGEIINQPFSFQDKNQAYAFNIFVRDSAGKIINEPFPVIWGSISSKSDLAYYKWESDSVCLVNILNHGSVQDSFKLTYSHNSKSLRYLNEPKK